MVCGGYPPHKPLNKTDMTLTEFSDQFDVLYNNITSNQAPGLNEYEKSFFLTKAEKEIVKNYFTASSKGNNLGQGFDDSAKRQADFSLLMKVGTCSYEDSPASMKIDSRSYGFNYPDDVFIVINETIEIDGKIKQVIPLRYDDYTRVMSKPYKRPLKNQVWRLISLGAMKNISGEDESISQSSTLTTKGVEIIAGVGENLEDCETYKVRYVRIPKPIITANLDGLSIDGYSTPQDIEIDPILHEDILQRAVELAKVAWTATGQDNSQLMMQAGQRVE